MPQAIVNKLFIYPIKGFDGIEVNSSKILASGLLEKDRIFSLIDSGGKYVNGKNYPEMMNIRTRYDLDLMTATLSLNNEESTIKLDSEPHKLEQFLFDNLNIKCSLSQDYKNGFVDDIDNPGPTIYSLESLNLLTEYFPDISLQELRRRFRLNIELTNNSEKPFHEDLAIGNNGFQFSQVKLKAERTCRRCPVPGRNPDNSEIYHGFAMKLMKAREDQSLDHLPLAMRADKYIFGVNTSLNSGADQLIETGEEVSY